MNATNKLHPSRGGSSWPAIIKQLIQHVEGQTLLLFLIAAGIFLLMSGLRPDVFPAWENLTSMMLQISEVGILSLGMMLAILIGGIDLSVSAAAVFTATLASLVLTRFSHMGSFEVIAMAIFVSLLSGILCGFINGFLIAKVGLPAILATLGTSTLYAGLSTAITHGSTITGFPRAFLVLGNGNLAGIPVPFLVLVFACIVASLILNRTVWGNRIYLLGSNARASLFSGVDNTKVTIYTHSFIGLISALAGLIMMARTDSINPAYGTSYVLQTLLVAVVGGISVIGGSGKVSGVFMALILLQFLSTSLNILLYRFPGANFFKNFAWGALLLAIMVVNFYARKRVTGLNAIPSPEENREKELKNE
jgi:simple sugar transport system permease protein